MNLVDIVFRRFDYRIEVWCICCAEVSTKHFQILLWNHGAFFYLTWIRYLFVIKLFVNQIHIILLFKNHGILFYIFWLNYRTTWKRFLNLRVLLKIIFLLILLITISLGRVFLKVWFVGISFIHDLFNSLVLFPLQNLTICFLFMPISAFTTNLG